MATASPKRPAYGKDVDLTVRVLADDVTPDGRVKVFYDGKRVGTGTLEDGKVVITVGRNFAPGKHTLVVKYLGSDELRASRDEVTIRVQRR